MNIRCARASDLMNIQHCNLTCLQDNKSMKYYMYHIVTWPQLSYVAEDEKGRLADSRRQVVTYDNLRPLVIVAAAASAVGNSAPPFFVHGYVVARMIEVDEYNRQGHITSLAVKGSYRRQGLEQKLVNQVSYAVVECFQGACLSVHVRKSNQVARHFYADDLGFEYLETKPNYYEDGEDACPMIKSLCDFSAAINSTAEINSEAVPEN